MTKFDTAMSEIPDIRSDFGSGAGVQRSREGAISELRHVNMATTSQLQARSRYKQLEIAVGKKGKIVSYL